MVIKRGKQVLLRTYLCVSVIGVIIRADSDCLLIMRRETAWYTILCHDNVLPGQAVSTSTCS